MQRLFRKSFLFLTCIVVVASLSILKNTHTVHATANILEISSLRNERIYLSPDILLPTQSPSLPTQTPLHSPSPNFTPSETPQTETPTPIPTATQIQSSPTDTATPYPPTETPMPPTHTPPIATPLTEPPTTTPIIPTDTPEITETLTPTYAPIDNDICPGFGIHSLPFSTSDTTEGKSNDYDPGAGICIGFSQGGPDVVYMLRLSVRTLVRINMIPELNFDCGLYVISDCGNPTGTCIAGSDRVYEGGMEIVQFWAESNTRYYIICDSFIFYEMGDFSLFLNAIQPSATPVPPTPTPLSPTATLVPPPNDLCPGIALPAIPFVTQGTTIAARDDYNPGELGCASGLAQKGPDVVYHLQAPIERPLRIQVAPVSGSLFDCSVYVVTDCEQVSQTCIVGADAAPAGQAETIEFTAVMERDYYIIVDSKSIGDVGVFLLQVSDQSATVTPSPTGSILPTVTPTQEPTAALTITPSALPSTSPTPSPPTETPSPHISVTSSPTLIPSATQLPSISPTQQPTITPSPYFAARLQMPSHSFHPGDTVWLRAMLYNSGASATRKLVVMLDINQGIYWFYPSWSSYPPAIDYKEVVLDSGQTEEEIIPAFIMPPGIGNGDGFIFWGALLNEAFTELSSDLDYWEFSFNE